MDNPLWGWEEYALLEQFVSTKDISFVNVYSFWSKIVIFLALMTPQKFQDQCLHTTFNHCFSTGCIVAFQAEHLVRQ
ncbi:hypothetical protein FRX31_023486 [Thalictrum thalictroides]|uniref:Uncharacterized protein n=1 Tax=Thalictrum thalictroides TaxID=46969 RepID=A0A7J6VP88_THATH|nr:hypothetical protein FRX31_023486 [Thalictrum thalictroides]